MENAIYINRIKKEELMPGKKEELEVWNVRDLGIKNYFQESVLKLVNGRKEIAALIVGAGEDYTSKTACQEGAYKLDGAKLIVKIFDKNRFPIFLLIFQSVEAARDIYGAVCQGKIQPVANCLEETDSTLRRFLGINPEV